MRVAVTVEQFWHPVPGGTARSTHETITALARTGDVELVGIAANHPDSAAASHQLTIPVRHSRLPRPVLYESWVRLARPRIEQLTGPVDVIWASAMVPPPNASTPAVATVHDVEFLDHPEWNSGRGQRFFPRAFRAAVARSRRIVVPSAAVGRRCVDHGVDPEMVAIAPWGVSSTAVSAEAVVEVRREYDLPERFVFWVGTVEPRKNLDGLVAAMGRLDLPLVVAGPDGWKADASSILAPLGHRAVRVGQVPERDLHRLYAAAAVFAFPSHAEGFGLPILEAMVQRTPVVTSAGGATEETAGGAAELADPSDPGSIADAIERVVADDDRADELRRAGLRRAGEMTWERTALRYRDVFAEVVGT